MPSSLDLGIDYGTSNLLIYQSGKGIVFDEPAVIAFNNETQQIIAFGREAYEMMGRTPRDITAIRPLARGIMENYDMTAELLRLAVSQALREKNMFSRPRAIISFPSSMHEKDQEELIHILFDVGIHRTQTVNRAIAVALSAGIPLDTPRGKMIVDISGGVTDATIISGRKIVDHQCSGSTVRNISGDSFTDAIITELKGRHSLLVDEFTAEKMKVEIGDLVRPSETLYMNVYGRDNITRLPKQRDIASQDIHSALLMPLEMLYDFILNILQRISPEFSSDISTDGIYLTGGGALLGGIAEALQERLRLPVICTDTPEYDVVLGLGYAAENPRETKQYLKYAQGNY